MTTLCRCGHRRNQHLRVFGLCTGEHFAALVGASPLSGRSCTCMRYAPESRVGLRQRVTRLFRKNA